MLSKQLDQNLGEGAVGVQAARDVTVNVGLSFSEVHTIATMVFKEDFVRMLDHAGVLAEARAERILNQYLERVEALNLDIRHQAQDPDFRYVLFLAQKAAARSGSENLQNVLVDLLVVRSQQPSLSLTQLVLNDAIEVVPRITSGQINVLIVAVVFRRIFFSGIATFDSFLKVMDIYLKPFLNDLPTSPGSIMHLIQAGCGAPEDPSKLGSVLQQQYPGIFQLGVSDTDVRIKGLSAVARGLLVPCDNNPRLLKVMGATSSMFVEICKQTKISDSESEMLDHVFHGTAMSVSAIKERCITARPYLADLFDIWDKSKLKTFVPSNVGLAIAHACLQQHGQLEPLSHWVE
ncbi:LPO_1073/Vpar_1526 family protein [Janthinobacterium sp. Mn2066]|uniref:LPO_1073/Vpar_1526 family protein n=1 Tax=Janthinobacterium sp. Mn2066 TaxID=3395264 RepID=UPI003BC90162